MAEPARKRMTVAEFLTWDDGTDTRYELIDGFPVAMSPPARAHRIIAANAVRRISEALDCRPPCIVESEAGIVRPDRPFTYFQADLAVTCRPHEGGEYVIPDPVLIIEILSPSTEDHDRKVKLPLYRTIPSVQEIVLIDPQRHFVELHRRFRDDLWLTDYLTAPDHRLVLESVGLDLPLSLLYANVAVETIVA